MVGARGGGGGMSRPSFGGSSSFGGMGARPGGLNPGSFNRPAFGGINSAARPNIGGRPSNIVGGGSNFRPQFGDSLGVGNRANVGINNINRTNINNNRTQRRDQQHQHQSHERQQHHERHERQPRRLRLRRRVQAGLRGRVSAGLRRLGLRGRVSAQPLHRLSPGLGERVVELQPIPGLGLRRVGLWRLGQQRARVGGGHRGGGVGGRLAPEQLGLFELLEPLLLVPRTWPSSRRSWSSSRSCTTTRARSTS